MKPAPSVRWTLLIASLLAGLLSAHAQINIPLRKITAPNHTVSDGDYNISMMYPEGWNVMRGFRWGSNNEKTTIVLQRTQPGNGSVSFFYQRFGGETERTPEINDWFKSLFQEKQTAKQKEFPNYQNDPRSLTYGKTATGLPKCSYRATFTRGSRRLVEYYVRVAGEKTYAMFLTEGTRAEIEAVQADIDQMADTLRLP
jgi:hypothetical protein